jgi:hypothetical protein
MSRFLLLVSMFLGSIASGVASLPPPSCTERCQYFDQFHGVCLYKTKCASMGHCSLETQCEYWDKFNGNCDSEKTDLVCSTYSPSQPQLTCSASCQYWDRFHEECDYKTSCNLQITGPGQACIQATSCERWDRFNEQCISEMTQRFCN